MKELNASSSLPVGITKVTVRLSHAELVHIRAAADERQQSVSHFVRDSALARAEEVWADRSRFVLDAEQWDAFMAALDAPTRALPRTERLFAETGCFEP